VVERFMARSVSGYSIVTKETLIYTIFNDTIYFCFEEDLNKVFMEVYRKCPPFKSVIFELL